MHPLAVAVTLLLAACEMSAEEYKRANDAHRERIAAERDARWRATYQPMIDAACKDRPGSADCAKTRYDVRRQFLADERDAEHTRQAGKPVVIEQAPRACSTYGNTTVCN